MVVAAVDRVPLEVVERVVHPPHVPFEAESEAPEVHGPADAGPRCRFLGDHQDAGVLSVDRGVQLLQELDRLEVLSAPELVRDPLAFLAAVVEVEHRSHGIHAQAVDVHLFDPVQSVRDEEVADLVAAVVEDERAPVGVRALLGVEMLVQSRAVEPGQRPLVAWEVGGHPVHDHTDAGLVERVDHEPEVVGCSEPCGRREVVADLVAPRSAEGMLGDR